MTDGLQGLERVLKRVNRLSNNITREIERPLKASGVYMVGSIQRNFQAQGRPDKWKPLSAKTLARRRKGRGKGGSRILIDRGLLKNSHSWRLVSDGVEIGTNKIQAKRQHFGYQSAKKGRGHATTPARPSVMFQEEDYDAIGRIFTRHIER